MAADAIDRTFAALADHTRRGVVELLRAGPHRAGQLATRLDISRPALTRHLRILRESELVDEVADDADGRARVYRLRRENFVGLRTWVERIELLWQEQLESFAAHVEKRIQPKTKRSPS